MTTGSPVKQLSDACIRFCWLRETAPGHLEHDGGLRIAKSDILAALLGIHPAQRRTSTGPDVSTETALAAISGAVDMRTVPTWARRRLSAILGPLAHPEQRAVAVKNVAVMMDLAARIAEAVGSSNDIEVHLPYIDRRNYASRFETLAGVRFVRWQGRIIPASLLAPGALHQYNAQWLAVASVDPAVSTEITFAHARNVPSGLVRSLLPVAADYQPTTSAESVVEIRQTLAPIACRGWNSAPHESTGPYYDVHLHASMAMQASVRRWFAWHWFSDLSRFGDVSTAYMVLAYLVIRPFPGRKRTDFSYDTLRSDWTTQAFLYSRRPLRQYLRAIYAALKATGNVKLARKYQPEQARFIIDRAKKDQKTIRNMIANEALLVDQMLRFGVELRSATSAFKVVNLAPDHAQLMSSRLRHIFREQDLSYLTTAVMMEATNALWTAMGGSPAISTTVKVSPAHAAAAAVSPAPIARVPGQSHSVPSQC